jgi:hypothetical protein
MGAFARAGRDGDTMLAHINPQEAGMLKRMGGRGTPNPATGLPEFATADGRGGIGDRDLGRSAADRGSTGGGMGGNSRGGDRGGSMGSQVGRGGSAFGGTSRPGGSRNVGTRDTISDRGMVRSGAREGNVLGGAAKGAGIGGLLGGPVGMLAGGLMGGYMGRARPGEIVGGFDVQGQRNGFGGLGGLGGGNAAAAGGSGNAVRALFDQVRGRATGAPAAAPAPQAQAQGGGLPGGHGFMGFTNPASTIAPGGSMGMPQSPQFGAQLPLPWPVGPGY